MQTALLRVDLSRPGVCEHYALVLNGHHITLLDLLRYESGQFLLEADDLLVRRPPDVPLYRHLQGVFPAFQHLVDGRKAVPDTRLHRYQLARLGCGPVLLTVHLLPYLLRFLPCDPRRPSGSGQVPQSLHVRLCEAVEPLAAPGSDLSKGACGLGNTDVFEPDLDV